MFSNKDIKIKKEAKKIFELNDSFKKTTPAVTPTMGTKYSTDATCSALTLLINHVKAVKALRFDITNAAILII